MKVIRPAFPDQWQSQSDFGLIREKRRLAERTESETRRQFARIAVADLR
jgi:hypothetical protein